MSEPDNQIPKAPTVKTSAVPLKKETVRITLRPSAPPSEPLPQVSPPPPTAQVPVTPTAMPLPSAPPPSPRAVAPGAPTVPLRSAPPPIRPAGAPTVAMGGAPPPPTRPMGGPPAPPAPIGSKTIPLAQAPARPVPAAPGARPSGPLAGAPAARPTGRLTGAPATQPLPKATMKLTKTEPISGGPPTAAISSAPIKSAGFDDEDESDNEGFLNGISVAAIIGSIAALFIALLAFQAVPPFNQVVPLTTLDQKKSWQNEPRSDWKIPVEYNPFSKKMGDGWSSTYATKKADEHAIPDRGE